MSARNELIEIVTSSPEWSGGDVTWATGLVDAHRAEVRTEALAEAKAEVVEWLVKKAHESTEVARLADKVERGAIRIFFDAERSAAAIAPQHYDKVPDPLDGCHWCACG